MRALLIRHAATAALGRFLSGRTPGVSLNEAGRQQALRLPRRVRREAIAAIYASPLERATETATPLAAERDLPLSCEPGLTEIDFGDWTGLSFAALEPLPEWQRYNARRSCAVVPSGESPRDVQRRIVELLERLRQLHGPATVAMVSHGDVIRAAVLHYLSMPLDLFARIEIGPASLTILELDDFGARFDGINLPDEA